jgi:hypothetical protein
MSVLQSNFLYIFLTSFNLWATNIKSFWDMICVHSFNHFHDIFISLDAIKWSDSRSGCFTAQETAPGSHCIGGWVDPTAGMDIMEKIKSLSLVRISNPDSTIVQPVVYSLYRLSYPSYVFPLLRLLGGRVK